MRSETAPHSSVKNLRVGLRAPVARIAVVAGSLALLVFALLVPVAADAATLAEKKAQAAKIARQVTALENDFDHLQERYRGAQYRLDDLDGDIEQLGNSLERTKGELDVAQTRLIQRVVTAYKDGDADNPLLALARSGSFSAFMDRMDTIDRVSGQDKQILERIKSLRTKVVRKKRQLQDARVEQVVVVAQRKRDKVAMESKLRKREKVLASVNGEVRAMVAAEQARQAAAARAAARASGEGVTAGAVETGGAGTSASTDIGSALSPSTAAAPPPVSGSASAAAGVAMGQIGVPYLWGGSTPSGFDCSGLVMWAFAQVGVSLPHSTYALWEIGSHVSRDQLQTGDLVFFSGLGHMGIYVGGGNFVHAPRSGTFVRVDSLYSSYGTNSYVGAVRV